VTRKLKPIELPVDSKLAEEVLNFPVVGATGIAITIGDRVREAIAAVGEANAFLSESVVAKLLADTLMKNQKRRGFPSLQVSPNGEVVLRIDYKEESATSQKAQPLPSLNELRVEAAEANVDISDLGRKKHEIIKRLESLKTDMPPDRLRDDVQESKVALGHIKLPRH
jgi:hypothetical protein